MFDDVEALVDLAAEVFAMKVPAQEDGFDRFAKFGEGFVGRMLNVASDKAAKDRFGLGRADTDGRRVFDQLVVLLADQFPIDRLRQDGLQVGGGVRSSGIGPRQFLNRDRLQPRHELETQRPAEGKGDCALAVGVDVLTIDLHLGAMMNYPLDHRGDLGGGGDLSCERMHSELRSTCQ